MLECQLEGWAVCFVMGRALIFLLFFNKLNLYYVLTEWAHGIAPGRLYLQVSIKTKKEENVSWMLELSRIN